MNLFNEPHSDNILPYQGEVKYYGKVFSSDEALSYTENLFRDIAWKNDEAKIFGHHFITKRKVAWYADREFKYTYSNTTKLALQWSADLIKIKNQIEQISGATYNACLLNLYHDGKEGMAWHSDDEKALLKHAPIASVSFGAERKFAFKHKQTHDVISLQLETGSLLIMGGETQTFWKHRLPPTTKVSTHRINLTFRTMLDDQ